MGVDGVDTSGFVVGYCSWDRPDEAALERGVCFAWSNAEHEAPHWMDSPGESQLSDAEGGSVGRFDRVRLSLATGGEELWHCDAWVARSWRCNNSAYHLDIVPVDWWRYPLLSHVMLRTRGDEHVDSGMTWVVAVTRLGSLTGLRLPEWQALVHTEPRRAAAELLRNAAFSGAPPLLVLIAVQEILENLCDCP